ncbi:hypothetical protein ACVWWF_001444 [Pseudomonas tolaasii]
MTAIASAAAPVGDCVLKPRTRSPFVHKFLANKGAVIGATVLLVFIAAALLAPWIAPYDPLKANFLAVRKAPSMLYWLGTDELGRDLFSRLLWGARSSLVAGGVSVAIAMAIGVPLGLIAGYFGGKLDAMISRVVDALLSCPFLVLAIALGAFLGPSLTNAMIAIGLSAMPIFFPPDPRPGAGHSSRGLPRRRPRHWPAGPLDHPALRAAQRDVAAGGASHADHRVGHPRRSQPVVPRPGPATALAFLGLNAQYREKFHGAGAVDVNRARCGDLHHRPVFQPVGGRFT